VREPAVCPEATTEKGGRGPVVLAVNDDPTQLRLLTALLQREGCRVLPAVDVRTALQLLDREGPMDVVVTDLHMPEIDGWTFCRLLRSPEFARHNHLPVLVISATFDGADAPLLVAELGANAFLPAPYDPAALVGLVRSLAAGRRPRAALGVLLLGHAAADGARLEAAFRAHGYDASCAADLAAGRRLLEPRRPDIVVVAHGASGVCAEEVLTSLKRDDPSCIVVVTTTDPRPEVAVELLHRRADGYVRAPYAPEYVVNVCERARRQSALGRIEELLEQRTRRLRESEARMRSLLDGLPYAVLVHNRAGAVLYANTVAGERLGIPPAELIGLTLRDLFAPDAARAVKARLAPALDAGTTCFEAEYRTQSGASFTAEILARPIDFEGVPAVLVVARDISRRKRVEAERAQLAAAVEQAGASILLADSDGAVFYVNAAFERITGQPRGTVLGKTLAELESLHPALGRSDGLREAIRTRAPWRGRLRVTRPDGSVAVTDASLLPVRGPTGAVESLVFTEQDVTQEVELEDQLRHAQKMEAIGALAGGLAHNFNNLLTGILGYANLLRRSLPPGEASQMAEIIEASAQRAGELTRQLLGFARRGKNVNAPVDIHAVIASVVRLCQGTFDKAIRVSTRLSAARSVVAGDPGQMEQALMNLALNARDAMAEKRGGELIFATDLEELDEAFCARHAGTSPGTYLAISVSDTGCGIPPALRGRIFEPFFTTKRPGEGTGMGLSMVYGTVKNHGGFIEVQSEVDRGSTFRVFLPAIPSPREKQAPPAPEEASRGSGRVLVVDDEEVIRQFASVILRDLGYDPVGVADGQEALEYYRAHPGKVDLVLLDMVMPKMNGRECFRKLKALDPKVRAVLSTGYGLNEAAQGMLDEGVAGFIQKPYVAAQLGKAVAAALGREPRAGPSGAPYDGADVGRRP